MTTRGSIRASASVALALALVAAACGADDGETGTGDVGASASYPVTVASCDVETTYEQSPERMVANDINMTEIALSLSLTDKMVGISGVADRADVREDLQSDFDAVEQLTENYIELEPLLGADPDFFFAGWNYGISEASGITPDALGERGINSYAITESCARISQKDPTTMDETYTDLTNIGQIFGVADQAEEIIEEMKSTVGSVESTVDGLSVVRTFVYDSGQDAPFTSPAMAIPNELIKRAGGENIFSDLAETWTTVSWEEVVDRDPECVVIVDYGDVTWEEKRQFMRDNPALNGITAVQNDCFVALPYAAMTPGVRNADAIETIARTIHPDAF